MSSRMITLELTAEAPDGQEAREPDAIIEAIEELRGELEGRTFTITLEDFYGREHDVEVEISAIEEG